MSDFNECDCCASKPGSPELCAGCLRNRDSIQKLKGKVDRYEELMLEIVNAQEYGLLNVNLMTKELKKTLGIKSGMTVFRTKTYE